jgi:hypothetical protein
MISGYCVDRPVAKPLDDALEFLLRTERRGHFVFVL